MAALFDGNVNFPQGPFESPPFKVSKQLNGITALVVQIASLAFPAGRTSLAILFSFDGGLTWPNSSGMTVDGPITGDRIPPFQTMIAGFGEGQTPTHAKYSSNAPSAFAAHVIVSG